MITLGTWTLIGAVCTFSAMTGAQFIGAHSPWRWSGWVLAAGVDTAFVMALQADATLARFGCSGGLWPTTFRWTTGACSVFVNIGDAALQRDLVGIAVHLIAPALLLVLGEAGPAWRRQLVTLERTTSTAKASDPRTPCTPAAHQAPGLIDLAGQTHSQTAARGTEVTAPVGQVSAADFASSPAAVIQGAQPANTLRTLDPFAVPARAISCSDGVQGSSATASARQPGDEAAGDGDIISTEPPADADEARTRIVDGLRSGLSQRETARRAHRSPTYVRKVWTTVEEASRTPHAPTNP
ncbi:hypothetical protein C7C46_29230 [Streptomyces tateyamensis]|uniref:DUF2637 domain-containing protein n=1 Tax=Streptomyces tateyamensis TaxID=565073 RepID=A0A2V4N632_9ACTN|nr:hypothetical protein C7C46_29230 [Streptomyces tateyamensis]